MKFIYITIILLIATSSFSQNRKKVRLNLTNALVVAQLDNPEDRYSLEALFTQVLTDHGVKAQPSLNYIKQGQDSKNLASDSIRQILKQKGIDTYILVSIRGYDKRYKPSKRIVSLEEALSEASIYNLYRQDIISVSFEFKFYRNGEFIMNDIIRCANIGDRAKVLKRFGKKTSKRLRKRWLPRP